MPVEKELWLPIIKEGMTPNTAFISRSVDLSENVDNNILHAAEEGVEPNVFIDNNVYPVPIVQRVDTPLDLPLHTFDSENTPVRNIEEKESAYGKMESVIRGHRRAIIKKTSMHAAHNWCPLQDSALTPVIATAGAVNASGVKRASFEDFLQLEAKFRALDVDMDSLVVVLNSVHLADLQAEDLKLYKQILAEKKLFSFSLFTYSKLPYFDTTAGQKKAFGSVPGANDTQASICYCDTEVWRASGETKMFVQYNDPKERGDVVGFQQRFSAYSFRNKYIGAIYSGK
jgi:hypothetical protein